MRKFVSILIIVGIISGFAVAYEGDSAQTRPDPHSADEKLIDLKADIVYPYDTGNDSTVYCLVGNFVAHHNGAVIMSDSAVRYNDQRLECFGNVLINKGDTYAYGDRADYNGEIDEARIYSQLVKVIDGDATLYTYDFSFNTKTNIGRFGGGGVVTNKENMLESDRGYYYADTREIICVENVEMRSEEYQMDGDSVIYNIATDHARFFSNTNIWNDKGEYLYADRGAYDKDDNKYVITLNGYILTEKQEVWSDSLDYYRERGYALLRNDIQIDDQEHKTLAFGDWGEYWKEPGDAFLTRNPSVIGYDPQQGDSLFMRSDTITLHTRTTLQDREEALRSVDIAAEPEAVADSTHRAVPESDKKDKVPERRKGADKIRPEKNSGSAITPAAAADSLHTRETIPAPELADSTRTDGPKSESTDTTAEEQNGDNAQVTAEGEQEKPLSEMTKEERKAKLLEIAKAEKERKKKEAEDKRKKKEELMKIKLDSIADRRQAKRTAQLQRQEMRDSVTKAKNLAREELRKKKMLARLTRKGIKVPPADSAAVALADSISTADMLLYDSIFGSRYDSLLAVWSSDSLAADSLAADSSASDTTYRLIRGYRNVKMYRSDFQAVCDSVSSSTIDSVIHMYIEPILWHEQNQITSESTDIHTKNQALDYAEFIGKPMMISKIDTLHFNQVAGKTMVSRFRDNEIYRDDVNGNAQTIYYMQEDGSPEVQGLMYIESADMTFYIEDKQISGITYRGSPTYIIYPMDKIPETQPLFLQGFTWQEERRPSQDSVFRRIIRPTQRAEKEMLPRPSFPIAERIDNYKRELIESGRWYDRNETLSSEVTDWLEANTDWKAQTEKGRRRRAEMR